MHRFPARRAPLWFVALLAVCLAAAARSVLPALVNPGGAGAHDGAPQLAFWFWVVALAEALWKGVEVAGKVALAILQYSVRILWHAATLLGKAGLELAHYAWTGLRKAWDLLRLTYTHILKPAWKFVWRWVDRAELWLKRTFGPLMKWLRRLRTVLLDIYGKYVRPVLDIIEVTRRGLRVLGTLGVQWARTLDAKLGWLEERIDLIPRLMIAELNKVINIVDRIMTADGLFQRLTFLRTLARDYAHAWNQLMWGYHKPVPGADWKPLHDKLFPKTHAETVRDIRTYIVNRTGPDAAMLQRIAARWRSDLRTP